MRVKERRDVAYVVRKGRSYGPYTEGEALPAINVDVGQARQLLRDGVLAEVLPGQLPEDVFAAATEPETDGAAELEESPAVAIEPEPEEPPALVNAAATVWPPDAPQAE